MGMGELMDALYAPSTPDSKVCTWCDENDKVQSGPHQFENGVCSTCGLVATNRLDNDMRWFEEQFAAEYPRVEVGSEMHTMSRYWFLRALQRCADYEDEMLIQINTELSLVMRRLQENLG